MRRLMCKNGAFRVSGGSTLDAHCMTKTRIFKELDGLLLVPFLAINLPLKSAYADFVLLRRISISVW